MGRRGPLLPLCKEGRLSHWVVDCQSSLGHCSDFYLGESINKKINDEIVGRQSVLLTPPVLLLCLVVARGRRSSGGADEKGGRRAKCEQISIYSRTNGTSTRYCRFVVNEETPPKRSHMNTTTFAISTHDPSKVYFPVVDI